MFKEVYPDVIIHERFVNCNNKLIIEIKKDKAENEDISYDEKK